MSNTLHHQKNAKENCTAYESSSTIPLHKSSVVWKQRGPAGSRNTESQGLLQLTSLTNQIHPFECPSRHSLVQQFLSFVHLFTSPIMYRPASNLLLRQSLPPLRSAARHRFLTTAPPHQASRSWKNSAARWGLGIAGVYYYNTSNVFAEEPARKCKALAGLDVCS